MNSITTKRDNLSKTLLEGEFAKWNLNFWRKTCSMQIKAKPCVPRHFFFTNDYLNTYSEHSRINYLKNPSTKKKEIVMYGFPIRTFFSLLFLP